MHQTNISSQTVLRRKRVAEMLGISLATLDRLRADSTNGFPAAIRLGEQAVGFLSRDICDWLASRPRVTQ